MIQINKQIYKVTADQQQSVSTEAHNFKCVLIVQGLCKSLFYKDPFVLFVKVIPACEDHLFDIVRYIDEFNEYIHVHILISNILIVGERAANALIALYIMKEQNIDLENALSQLKQKGLEVGTVYYNTLLRLTAKPVFDPPIFKFREQSNNKFGDLEERQKKFLQKWGEPTELDSQLVLKAKHQTQANQTLTQKYLSHLNQFYR